VLLAFRAWGMKWGEYAPGTEPGVKAVYRETGEVVDAAWQIPPDAYPFTFDALDASLTEGYLKERNEKLVAHKARKQQARKTRA